MDALIGSVFVCLVMEGTPTKELVVDDVRIPLFSLGSVAALGLRFRCRGTITAPGASSGAAPRSAWRLVVSAGLSFLLRLEPVPLLVLELYSGLTQARDGLK